MKEKIMANLLKAGFARLDVTPPLGIPLHGYFIKRYADGILDPLQVNAVALSVKDEKVVLVTIDHCGLERAVIEPIRKIISEKTGIKLSALFVHCTHTHNGPTLLPSSTEPEILKYKEFLTGRLVDVVTFAIADLKPAKMGLGVGKAPNVAFIRRYRMKDGSVKTNPGVNNPDIVAPIGQVDERVNVLRFDRENAPTIILANFGNHPDTVGGTKISGDWPALTRNFVEKSLDNTRCIFFNGAQGDVNHVNVNPKAGDFNDLVNDFDGCSRGYGHTRHIARVVAGAVMQVYDKVEYVDVEKIGFLVKTILIPSNRPKPEELPEARRITEIHAAGRDSELPYKGMMLTTVIADAARKIRLADGPDNFELDLIGIKLGDVAFIGIPGEPFSEIGNQLKRAEDYKLVIPTCLTNGYQGYFPTYDAYAEGGYEAGNSNFRAGVAERIIAGGIELLKELRK
jgi:hypothetical protein